MAFGRIVLAWLVAAAWFIAWEYGARRLRREAGGRDVPPVKPAILAVEALWLALLGGLWFASLGAGVWWLVLLLLGLLVNWTPVLGRDSKLPPGKRAVALGVMVARVLVAGVLAGVVL